MSRYPDIDAGARVTSQLLDSMLAQVMVKTATESRASTTTLTIDSDLQFAGEAGATYFVEFNLMPAAKLGSGDGSAGTTPGGFVTEWSVPGDASGFKSVLGPGSAASNGSADNIAMRAGVHNFGTNIEYSGVRNDSDLGFSVREYGVITLVTAGTIGIAWAQRFSTANVTKLFGGSYMRAKRLS